MAGSTSKAALLPSSSIKTSTGDLSFRRSVLEPCGCEYKEGWSVASTTHFKNLVLGTENLVSSALQIDTSEEFWKEVTRTFSRLHATKAGKAAYFDAIAGYFLKEIKPFYRSTPDRDQHDEWEAARLIEHEFYIENDTAYARMSLLPLILSTSPPSKSITTASQPFRNTETGRGKSAPLSRKLSLSTADASRESKGTKRTLELKYVQGIRPTAVYWLQRQKISSKHQHMISAHTYESDLRLLAPYLTVMLVDDSGAGPNDSEIKALNNLSVIGSIAVYNRYLLKERSLQRHSYSCDPKEIESDLRHYGLVFDKVKFRLWCFRAKVDLKPADDSKNSAQTSSTAGSSTSAEQKTSQCKWKGCELEELWKGNLIQSGHVDTLVGYLNKIQVYGSRVHGPGIEKDLNRCFADHPAGRPSLSGDE